MVTESTPFTIFVESEDDGYEDYDVNVAITKIEYDEDYTRTGTGKQGIIKIHYELTNKSGDFGASEQREGIKINGIEFEEAPHVLAENISVSERPIEFYTISQPSFVAVWMEDIEKNKIEYITDIELGFTSSIPGPFTKDGSGGAVSGSAKAKIDYIKQDAEQDAQEVAHPYENIEKEVLRLINVERTKDGVASLSWYEEAHSFTKTRATELIEFYSSVRPDKSEWSSIYTDNQFGLVEERRCMLSFPGETEMKTIYLNYATSIFNTLMNSSHGREVLGAKYTHMAVSVSNDSEKVYVALHLFGN